MRGRYFTHSRERDFRLVKDFERKEWFGGIRGEEEFLVHRRARRRRERGGAMSGIRGDDSLTETNAAVDGTRSLSRGAAAGYRYFPLHSRWKALRMITVCAQLSKRIFFLFFSFFALFFPSFFLWSGGGGHERDERRKKFKKKEENGKKRRKRIIIACVLSSNVKRTFVRSDDDDDDERKTNKTERTGEGNTTRSPFRILIQHHQTLVPSFVEWWCFSA